MSFPLKISDLIFFKQVLNSNILIINKVFIILFSIYGRRVFQADSRIKLMKNVKPEIQALIIGPNEEKAEKCFKLLKSSKELNEEITIIPRFWIAGKSEEQYDLNKNFIIVGYVEFQTDFDKIRNEMKHFHQTKNRYIISEKEEAKQWVKEISDFGFRVFVNFNDEKTVLSFRDAIKIAIPATLSAQQDY